VPYVVAAVGVARHSQRFADTVFRSYEGAFTAGGGLRVALSRRVYVAPELRTGWEPHLRTTVTVGVRSGK
jgi:hypothetical protein